MAGSKSESITISQLMRALGRAVHDLQHSRSGRVANKVRGKAKSYIRH